MYDRMKKYTKNTSKEVMEIVENYLPDNQTKEKVLGRNAIEFYDLN